MVKRRNFEYPTTEAWTTTSSWYNSTSSFTTTSSGLDEIQFEDLDDAKTQESAEETQPTYITNLLNSVSTTPFSTVTKPGIAQDDGMVPPLGTGDGIMRLTKIMFGPLCFLLLISTIVLLYLILRKFRHLIRLYFSLIFYSLCQLFLFTVLTVSSVLQMFVSFSGACDAVNTVEYLALTLPGYGILLVSVARWVCVAYPTQYQRLLNPRLQIWVMVILVCLLTLLSSMPMLGMCSNVWLEDENLVMEGMCHLEKAGCYCTVFRWLLVSVGFILPAVGVFTVYCLIVRLLIQHKKKEKSLGKCKGSDKCGKVDYDYKPITVREKLSQLKAIGQDAIPWSIFLILILNVLTTLPWIPHIFAPELYLKKPISDHLALDLMYVIMLGAISFSPVTYILTTPVMRAELVRIFSSNTGHKKFSVMSKNTESTAVDV